jgi:hypothetical protein
MTDTEAGLAERQIMDYASGEYLGDALVDMDRYYAAAQWPQGLVAADTLLSTDDTARLGLTHDQTIYIDP